jgi:hypothetical protein
MEKYSGADFISESSDNLSIVYPASDRILQIVFLLIYLAILVIFHCIWYRTSISLFSDREWLTIPACLAGDAGLLGLFLWSGSKSTVAINMDGTVRHGVAKWKFPGRMTALVSKTGGTKGPPAYWLDLRYGPASLRFRGGNTEGQTIGMSVQINRWIQQRVQGTQDPFDIRTARSPISLANFSWIFLILAVLIGAGLSDSGTYLNEQAQLGSWGKVAATVVALIVASVTGIRWKAFASAGIQRGVVILLAEGAIAALIILASGAIAARSAQTLEVSTARGSIASFDAPLYLTRTTRGKGCHRYLRFLDPSLGRMIQYCDPHSFEYWSDATHVQVTERRSDLGVQIISVDGAS